MEMKKLQAPGQPAPMLGRSYDSRQLDMFKAVLDEMIAELLAEESAFVAADRIQFTKFRLASAIFVLADQGEHDPTRLRQRALAMLRDDLDMPTLLHVLGQA